MRMNRRTALAALAGTSAGATFAEAQQEAPIRLRAPYQVPVGPTPVALTSSGVVLGVTLKAICPGYMLYVGVDNTLTTTNGWPMSDGDTLTVDVSNANQIWMIANGADQRVAVLPYRRQ